jgi:nicotinamide riboside transporter PnuC
VGMDLVLVLLWVLVFYVLMTIAGVLTLFLWVFCGVWWKDRKRRRAFPRH